MQGSRARLSVWIALRSDLSSQRIKHTRHYTNVRFWHKADICLRCGDVCFWGKADITLRYRHKVLTQSLRV